MLYVWTKALGGYCDRVQSQALFEDCQSRRRNTAFRGLGGGMALYPGRRFAATEMLASVALFMSRFEMKPASGNHGAHVSE